jgi:hypothetical protein
MRVKACLTTVALVAAVATCRPAHAQSLGDVAKQEEERRKDVKPSAKVYTNRDLGGSSSAAPQPETKPSGNSGPPSATADKGKDESKDAAKDGGVKDQKYWSSRKKELQAKLERDKVLADAMQSRVNALTADFAARSDPAQRAVIEADRKRALTELEGLQKTMKDDQKGLADLDEEARKASVPPGWLR